MSDIYIAEAVLKILKNRRKAVEESICYGNGTPENYLGLRASLAEINTIEEQLKEKLNQIEYEDIDD